MDSKIPSKGLKVPHCASDIQVITFEINLKKQKWLVVAIYRTQSSCKNYFITELTKISGSSENTVILEDFNMQPANQTLETFLEDNSFVNLIKSNTCLKPKSGSCINLILNIKAKSFQNTEAIKTGISDHHVVIFSFLKTTFIKMQSNKLQYRNYKLSEAHSFLQNVGQLSQETSYTEWEKYFMKTLIKHTPLKKKLIRGNHKSFITKKLEKAFMKRSALEKRENISNNSEIIKLHRK